MITLSNLSSYSSDVDGSSSLSDSGIVFISGSSTSFLGTLSGSSTSYTSGTFSDSIIGSAYIASMYASSPSSTASVSISSGSATTFDLSKLDPIDLRPYIVSVVHTGDVVALDSSILSFSLGPGFGYKISPRSSYSGRIRTYLGCPSKADLVIHPTVVR